MKLTQIAGVGIVLAFLLSGCWNGVMAPAGLDTDGGGNVSITVQTDSAERTLRPSDLSASAFERIELEFTNSDNEKTTITLGKGETSGSVNLDAGTWNVSAKGFIKIGDKEYEAAYETASVAVTANQKADCAVTLETGIFSGSPGVFSYDIKFEGVTVTTASLEINPLNNIYGPSTQYYGSAGAQSGTGANLAQQGAGSLEAAPGYHLVTISAVDNANRIAVWNELVHIYSGQETTAVHSFTAADFGETITVSGKVIGGELEGERIESALVAVYGDPLFLTLLASIEIPSFTRQDTSPFYYQGEYSTRIPAAYSGTVFFRIEERLNGGTHGARTFTRYIDSTDWELPTDGSDMQIDLGASYSWGQWSPIEGAMSQLQVDAEGTMTVTAHKPAESWQIQLDYYYPVEIHGRYVFEFEAWADEGEHDLQVQYFHYNWHIVDYSDITQAITKTITMNESRQKFTVISNIPIDVKTTPTMFFFLDNPDTENVTYHIKPLSIKKNTEYTIEESSDGTPRFTAQTDPLGIRLTVNLKDFPEEVTELVINNVTTGGGFSAVIDPDADSYEVIYPYVDKGKEYTFALTGWNIYNNTLTKTITAESGRGELGFTNAAELAVVQEGTTLGFNKDPVLSLPVDALGTTENNFYMYEFSTGASWNDPALEWRFALHSEAPEKLDLTNLDSEMFPEWINVPEAMSSVGGQSCLSAIYYSFDYVGTDIYPTGSRPGTFRTPSIEYAAPFTFPNVVSDVFTAEPHAEGVKLIVDIKKLPPETSYLYFHIAGNSVGVGVSSYEWQNEGGKYYGQDKIEIIYPFVNAGKSYEFPLSIQGTGRIAQANVTAQAGRGELTITNAGELGMLYNSQTKTLSLSGTPVVSSASDTAGITDKYWTWTFFRGHNWDNAEWVGSGITDKNIILSRTFDEIFASTREPNLLSGITGFANCVYMVQYDGYYVEVGGIPCAPFTFPVYEDPNKPTVESSADGIIVRFKDIIPNSLSVSLSDSTGGNWWFDIYDAEGIAQLASTKQLLIPFVDSGKQYNIYLNMWDDADNNYYWYYTDVPSQGGSGQLPSITITYDGNGHVTLGEDFTHPLVDTVDSVNVELLVGNGDGPYYGQSSKSGQLGDTFDFTGELAAFGMNKQIIFFTFVNFSDKNGTNWDIRLAELGPIDADSIINR